MSKEPIIEGQTMRFLSSAFPTRAAITSVIPTKVGIHHYQVIMDAWEREKHFVFNYSPYALIVKSVEKSSFPRKRESIKMMVA